MSENTTVHAQLTAHDSASPVITGLLSNIRKLERTVNGFNASFANLGRTGANSMAGLSRTTESIVARMSGLTTSAKSASRSIVQDFKLANAERLRFAQQTFRQLEQLESNYRRQIERTAVAERRAERRSGMRGREFGTTRMPAPRIRSLVFGGAAVTGIVAGSFAQRMRTEAAEVRNQMFGDLSKAETSALRKNFADKAGIKYGIGTTKALDSAVEGLKAGIAKDVVGEFADLSLKAQAGLDVDGAETAKLMGRLATQMPWNKGRFNAILNGIAVANNVTASSGQEIIEGMRRSLSALATTRMTPEQLAAINATGISLGVQPFKMGTFTSFLTSQIAGADSARGQQAKDLGHAASALGFGSRAGMAKAMRDNPLQAIEQILDNLAKMPEKMRTRVAKEIGGREWMDELLTFVLGRDKLKEVIKEIANKPGFLDKTSLLKLRSLQGRWASITATIGLVVEKIGAGFESAFHSISDAIINRADTFNFDTIRDHLSALVDGFRQGLGLKNWGEAVTAIADMFNSGSLAKLKAFGKGFAEGLRETLTILKGAFTGIASLFGKGDAESMGKFTARLLGLTVALALIAPVVNVLGSISLFLLTIGAVAGGAAAGIGALFVALSVGLKLSLGWVADRVFDSFRGIVDPIVGAIKSIAVNVINKVRGWLGLSPIGDGGGASGSWSQRSGSPGASGSWSPSASATDFSGSRRRVAAINATPNIAPISSGGRGGWNDSPANAVRSSFNGTVDAARSAVGVSGSGSISSAAYEKMFAGTSLAGKQAEIEASAKANGIPPALLASVIAHETGKGRNVNYNNVAGIMDSETGFSRKKGYASLSDGIAAAGRVVAKNYRKAGGNIDAMGSIYAPVGVSNDPRGLNSAWPSAVKRYNSKLSDGITDRITSGFTGQNPVDVASQFLGKNEYTNRDELASFVGSDVLGRANAWCAKLVNASLKRAGIAGSGSAVANSFQRWGTSVKPEDVMKGDVLLQANHGGPNQPGGHVGFATGNSRMVGGRLQLEMLSGNDGDRVRTGWRNADKLMARRAISNVPTPSELIAKVPVSNGAATRGLLEKNGSAMLGAGGPVAININGNSHDPETLATLVQRRINESMNWRLHDIDTAST